MRRKGKGMSPYTSSEPTKVRLNAATLAKICKIIHAHKTVPIVRGHSSALLFPFRQLPLVSRDFRSSSVSVTSSVVFLIEPTAEELPSSFRPAVRLLPSAPFIFIFIFIFIFYFSLWRDGITPSVIIFPIVPLSF